MKFKSSNQGLIQGWARIFLQALCLALLSGCSSESDQDQVDREKYKVLASENDMATESDCAKGKKAFEETVHKYVRSSGKCVECHDSAGPGPGFAVKDLGLSYLRIKNRVQWATPDKSVFVKRGGEDHCNCGVTEELLNGLLTEWWENGEKECKQAGHYVTDPVNVPALGSPNSGWKKVNFSLKNTSELLEGSSVELEIENFADAIEGSPGAYRIRKPRLISAGGEVKVTGLQVLINGFPDTNSAGYSQVEIRGTKGTTATASTKTLIFLKNNPETDVFLVSIDKVEKMEPLKCTDEQLFVQKMHPILQQRNCFICHGGGPDSASGIPQARASLDTFKSNTELCRELKIRSNYSDPSQSLFWLWPSKNIFGHPKTNFISTENDDMSAWVQSESKEQ